MTSRIDSITVVLEVADEFEGNRVVSLSVPLPDKEFEAAVRQKWVENDARLLARARGSAEIDPFG